MTREEAIKYGKIMMETIKDETSLHVFYGDGREELRQFLEVAIVELEKP